ncbi:hypothetical protein [Paraclostridium sordellii]|uniref:Uncharacterized protein n=1 Tax=Paraclostridium sordellii TaxID=1505 RepID=A0A9P1PAD8_PARSO|nr:hypothetical protein [Paeniclostridium sordellii]CEO35084.1 Uncharacterised protein [[Clostridium] sordellii] [Paeniclostridium sordellii]
MKRKRIIKSLLLVAGVLSISSTSVFADAIPQTPISLEQKTSSKVALKSDQKSVNYSNFIKNGGGEQWVNLTLDGAEFNTSNPNEILKAITQNYDVKTTLSVSNDGKSIELGVYEPNAGIEYLDNWEITIKSSVLTSDTDASVKIPVNYDINTSTTPKVITSKQSVTIDELKNGFELPLTAIGGAVFNTDCIGNNVRLSLMQTANIPVTAYTFCDLDLTNISFFVKALNDIPESATEFTFRLEQERNAVLSPVPLIVKIPIVR